MTSSMDRFLVAAWVCGSALTGFSGVDAVWSNTETTAASWADLANWTDPDGNALTVAPTNAVDNADLSAEKTGTQAVLPEGVKPAVRLRADDDSLSLDLVPQGTVILFR